MDLEWRKGRVEMRDASGGERMQEVDYRGGLLRFRVPAAWVVELGEEGGGTFYEDRPDGGVLRLNVLTFRVPSGTAADTLRQALTPRAEGEESGRHAEHAPGEPIEFMPNGNAMRTYTQAAQDGEDRVIQRYWEIANAVPPDHLRLAIFSYTFPPGDEDKPDQRRLVAVLDRELRAAVFAAERGR